MFIRLKDKPFYFLTDRDTHYTYFVDNTAHQKHLYYPQQFETMSPQQIRNTKWSLVRSLILWAPFHSEQMTNTDHRICISKAIDAVFTIAAGFLMGSVGRRALFRIELPFFDMAFQRSVFQPRWIKAAAAYTFAAVATYNSFKGILKEEFLVDLALEYRPNFDKSLTCPEVDPIFDRLS